MKKLKDFRENVSIVEWVLVIFTFFVPLISFAYMDTDFIIRCGIDVGKSIFDGQFFDYYNYAKQSEINRLMGHPPTYDIIFYITVGIWELPVSIIEQVTGTPFVGNIWVTMYSKLYLLGWIVLCAGMIKKIAKELEIRNCNWVVFMFLTTGFLVAYVGIAGQYDIMGLFFTLCGIYFYLKGEMGKFELLFIIAIQYKFFPLFVFLPLLLLRVKEIKKILLYVIPPFATIAIFRIPFLNDGDAIVEKSEIGLDMLDRILRNRIPIFETEVPLSFLAIGAVCIWCYFKEVKEDEKYYTIYISFLSLALLFLSFPFFPYWIVYLTPWIPLLYFMRRDADDKFMLVEAGMTLGIMIAQISHFYWVFELKNLNGMFLDHFIYKYEILENPITILDFTCVMQIDDFESLFYGLYILCMVTLLIIYRPIYNRQCKEEGNFRKKMWIRFIAQYLVAALPVGLYFISVLRQIM